MALCLVDAAAQRKRLEAVMLRLLCTDAEHVTVTVAVCGADGDDDVRKASALVLIQELGKADLASAALEKLELATKSFERKGNAGC